MNSSNSSCNHSGRFLLNWTLKHSNSNSFIILSSQILNSVMYAHRILYTFYNFTQMRGTMSLPTTPYSPLFQHNSSSVSLSVECCRLQQQCISSNIIINNNTRNDKTRILMASLWNGIFLIRIGY